MNYDQAVRSLYALGRELDNRDQPTVREIMRQAAPQYRAQDLILAIVNSAPFRMRQIQERQTSELETPVVASKQHK